MVVKDMNYGIFVEEWDLDNVVELVGVNFAPDASIFAALTHIHSLFQFVEDLHLFGRQRGQWRVSIRILLVKNDGLEWAHDDDLLSEAKLSRSFLLGVLDSGETVLSPVLATSDIDPLFVGLGPSVLDLGEISQVSDVETPCLVVRAGVISVNDDDIEVPGSDLIDLIIWNIGDLSGEVSAVDELDDISSDLIWKLNLGAGNDDLFFGQEVPSLGGQGISVAVFLDFQGKEVLADKDTGDVARVMVDIFVCHIVIFTAQNGTLLIIDFFGNLDPAGVFPGIVDFLQSGENPLSIFIQKVVEFDQVTALDEMLLAVQVRKLYHLAVTL